MELGKQWFKCRIHPGMFSDERIVEIGERDFFVEEKSVRNEKDGYGDVEVRIFEMGGTKWVELPTNYSDAVPLPT
jgi:hypothetical protein